MKELHEVYRDNIKEFIRHGEYDPSDYALIQCWRVAMRVRGAAEVVSEAINGDESLSQDIADWIFHHGRSGDQGIRRVNEAFCDYVKKAYVDYDESLLWDMWQEQSKPDPMDLAKQAEGF